MHVRGRCRISRTSRNGGHRTLDAWLKGLEKAGATIADGDKPGHVRVTVAGEQIDLEIREKLNQVKRPPNEDEKRWRSLHTRLVTELVGAGRLYVCDPHLEPGRVQARMARERRASDRDAAPGRRCHIAGDGPPTRRGAAGAGGRGAARGRAPSPGGGRASGKRGANRWRRLVEFARVSEEVRLVRALVVELRKQPVAREQAGDRLFGEWLDWLKRVQSWQIRRSAGQRRCSARSRR